MLLFSDLSRDPVGLKLGTTSAARCWEYSSADMRDSALGARVRATWIQLQTPGPTLGRASIPAAPGGSATMSDANSKPARYTLSNPWDIAPECAGAVWLGSVDHSHVGARPHACLLGHQPGIGALTLDKLGFKPRAQIAGWISADRQELTWRVSARALRAEPPPPTARIAGASARSKKEAPAILNVPRSFNGCVSGILFSAFPNAIRS